jgi:hypothetical protein
MADARQGLEGLGGGQIDERSGDSGDRHASLDGHIRWVELPHAMDDDSGNVSIGDGADLRGRRFASDETEDERRGSTAKNGSITAGQDCRHVRGVDARSLVADAVDAVVGAVEHSLLDATAEALAGEARGQGLPRGDDAMLPSRDSSDSPIR